MAQKAGMGRARCGRRLERTQVGRSCCHFQVKPLPPLACTLARAFSNSHFCLCPHPFSTQQLVFCQSCKRDHATPLLQALQRLSNTLRIKRKVRILDYMVLCDLAPWRTFQTHLTFTHLLTLTHFAPTHLGVVSFLGHA